MNGRELLIGLDLGNEYSQLSYALNLSDEPTSMLLDKDKEEFLIPTVVGLSTSLKQWVYGKDALKMVKDKEAHVATNLLDKAKEASSIKIYDSLYEPIYLLERYIYKILMEVKLKWPDKTIKQMVVTVDNPDPLIINGLYKALENLGLTRDRVCIQSYSSSYLAYVLSQEKGIWMNDVALFDFGKKSFDYLQMSIERRQVPHIAQIKKKNYNDSIKYSDFESIASLGNFDYILERVLNDALYMQIVSAIYFTGEGFIDGIPINTIKKISKGRRVFIGQNLYCKGACYWAAHLAGRDTLDGLVFLVDDTIHYSLSITINDNDIEKDMYIASLGSSIYEVPKSVGLILDDEDQVKYKVRNKRGLVILEDRIVLEDLPKRPNKTSRIEVSPILISKSRFKLQIKDKGFGQMYPAIDKIWEKEVLVNG